MKWAFRYAYLLVAMNWRELTFRASNTKKNSAKPFACFDCNRTEIANVHTLSHTLTKIMYSHITDNGKIRDIGVVKSDKIIVKVVTDKNAIFTNLFFFSFLLLIFFLLIFEFLLRFFRFVF